MFGQGKDGESSSGNGPSPAAGLLFVLGCFGLFYSLIAFVDPML